MNKKQKLAMENVPKANERLKVVFCTLNSASPRRVYKRKECIHNNTSIGFCTARSAQVRSIALKVRLSACGLQGSFGACLSDGASARADMDFALNRILLSLSADAFNRVLLRLEL